MNDFDNKDYKSLNVWKESRKLVKMVYELTANFRDSEKFGLTTQMRRCAVSIASNIAEGIGRNSKKETKQFFYVAKGSVYELETQLYLVEDLKFANPSQVETILNQLIEVRKLIIGFIKYLEKETIAN